MRVFVLGAGVTGGPLARLLARRGHRVWCGDRNVERARRFVDPRIDVVEANARNLRSIVRAGAGCHLLVNTAPPAFNETVLRAALWLRADYLDLAAHLARQPFKPEQLGYARRFEAKRRLALICAGVAPGLTNLLVRRSAELLDHVVAARVRLLEETESDDPVSTWSAESAFDEAVSRPRVLRHGRFLLERKFAGRETFAFAGAGRVPVMLAAQDEVTTVPRFIPMREMDAKIGGNEFERLRRWHRAGRLRPRQQSLRHFPRTPTPRKVAQLIRRGVLHNARFAASVLVTGTRDGRSLLVRHDVKFPSLYQLRLRGLWTTPIAYATAQLAALFVACWPERVSGVLPPEALPAASRAAVLAGLRARGIEVTRRIVRLPAAEESMDEHD